MIRHGRPDGLAVQLLELDNPKFELSDERRRFVMGMQCCVMPEFFLRKFRTRTQLVHLGLAGGRTCLCRKK
jgi:hypothetical protein